MKVLCGEDTPILTRPAGSQRSGGSRAARRRSASGGCPMWPQRRNRAVSAAILLLFHAFAGGHAKRGHDGLGGRMGGTRTTTTKFIVRARPRPTSRPDLDGGARLRRTHLENPRSVSRIRLSCHCSLRCGGVRSRASCAPPGCEDSRPKGAGIGFGIPESLRASFLTERGSLRRATCRTPRCAG